MRLSRFLLIFIILTSFSLLYVHQQTEVFRLAYACQKNLGLFKDLLDKNTVLRYNIGKDASLVRIGKRISSQTDFQMPGTYRLVKLASVELEPRRQAQRAPSKQNIVASLFSIKRQAEAKTINP